MSTVTTEGEELRPPSFILDRIRTAERSAPTADDCEIVQHEAISDRYMWLRLRSRKIATSALPGQFVMLSMVVGTSSTPALPRPMAIYATDHGEGTIDIVYGVVGRGTRRLSTFMKGSCLHVIGALGQPFVVPSATSSVLLVGRGIGTCSLTTVAQNLLGSSVEVVGVTSARSSSSLIGSDFYRRNGVRQLYEVTDSAGTSTPDSLRSRLMHDLDSRPPQIIMTCGSNRLAAMCQQLAARWHSEVQMSIEAHMACGLGYCHGCASGQRAVGEESPLVCADGPVFSLRGAVYSDEGVPE